MEAHGDRHRGTDGQGILLTPYGSQSTQITTSRCMSLVSAQRVWTVLYPSFPCQPVDKRRCVPILLQFRFLPACRLLGSPHCQPLQFSDPTSYFARTRKQNQPRISRSRIRRVCRGGACQANRLVEISFTALPAKRPAKRVVHPRKTLPDATTRQLISYKHITWMLEVAGFARIQEICRTWQPNSCESGYNISLRSRVLRLARRVHLIPLNEYLK